MSVRVLARRTIGAGLVLTLIALVLIMAPLQAQEASTHVLFGDGAGATVDGAPLLDGSQIDAIDSQGASAGVGEWDGGFWFLTVTTAEATVRIRFGEALSGPLPLRETAFQIDQLALVSPGGLTPTEISLATGWNLVAWLGQTTDVVTALESVADSIDSMFTWAPDVGFQRYAPAGLAFLNAVEVLLPAQGLWVLATQDVVWLQQGSPAALLDRTVILSTGFNLVAWTGTDGLEASSVFEPAVDIITSIFHYDTGAPRFQRYTPGGLAILNSLANLRFGTAIWVVASQEVAFDIAAP